MLLEPTKNKLKQWRVIEQSVNKCNFFSQMFWIMTKWMKITEKQICEDQIVTFKQSHILLYQGLLFLTRSTCVIVDARSHTCKSHDFIPRYDIIIKSAYKAHSSRRLLTATRSLRASLPNLFSLVFAGLLPTRKGVSGYVRELVPLRTCTLFYLVWGFSSFLKFGGFISFTLVGAMKATFLVTLL